MKKETGKNLLRILFFTLSVGYLELLMRLTDRVPGFSALVALRLLLSGAAVGLSLWLLGTLIPQKKAARFLVGLLLFLLGALFIAYHCCQVFFGTYFQLSFMLSMSGQLVGGFLNETIRTILRNLWFFPLALLPFLLFLLFRKTLLPEAPPRKALLLQTAALMLTIVCAVLSCRFGGDRDFYTTDYTANSAVPRFGLIRSLELEARYAVFGKPLPEIRYVPTEPTVTVPSETTVPPTETAQPTETEETVPPTEPPVVYGENVADIDFSTLMEQDEGTLFGTMDAYYASQTPTMQNPYTGLFAGKNLVFLTAEAFSTPVIDPERTPTLYRLSTSGFVFENFYQPGWTQSTTGGEFANMTGIIPNWISGSPAFQVSAYDAMHLAMGWKFRELGYTSLAYHNNNYAYYNRHQTHPNLGYDYQGVGNGLVLDNPQYWPLSDLEMMEATVDGYIQDYVENGNLFNVYYITVSGHANYGFSYNDMANKNADTVEGLAYSDPVRAYLAAQMELEYAMTYLVDALEQAGIADDTVIVLAADHYPYALTQDCPRDYYAELSGVADNESRTSRYRNTLILWCGSMEEPVVVDTPCSSIDIVPTLYNLFGISYDSRLLSGKDVLDTTVEPGQVSTAMPIVVFPSYGNGRSWITNAGIYEAADDQFHPFPGVEVSDSYVTDVSNLVSDRWSFSRMLLEYDYFRHIFPDWQGTAG